MSSNVLFFVALVGLTGLVGEAHAQVVAGAANAVVDDAGGERKLWTASAQLQFRSLAIADRDPGNDMMLLYGAMLSTRVPDVKGLSLAAAMSVRQAFTAEEGESGFQIWQNLTLRGMYSHAVPVKIAGKSYNIGFNHNLNWILPTSRRSQKQTMLSAFQQGMRVSTEILPRLSISIAEMARLNVHRYAERAGLQGGMNTRAMLIGVVALGYGVPLGRFGSLSLGADTHTTYLIRYASRDPYESALSDSRYMDQWFGWDVYASYAMPQGLSVTASIEHGQTIRDDGSIRFHFVNRDETQVALTLSGSY